MRSALHLDPDAERNYRQSIFLTGLSSRRENIQFRSHCAGCSGIRQRRLPHPMTAKPLGPENFPFQNLLGRVGPIGTHPSTSTFVPLIGRLIIRAWWQSRLPPRKHRQHQQEGKEVELSLHFLIADITSAPPVKFPYSRRLLAFTKSTSV